MTLRSIEVSPWSIRRHGDRVMVRTFASADVLWFAESMASTLEPAFALALDRITRVACDVDDTTLEVRAARCLIERAPPLRAAPVSDRVHADFFATVPPDAITLDETVRWVTDVPGGVRMFFEEMHSMVWLLDRHPQYGALRARAQRLQRSGAPARVTVTTQGPSYLFALEG